MKKKDLFLLALIALCLITFLSYRVVDRARTDTKPPVIHISEELMELSVNAPQGVLLQGVTALDDISGDVTRSVVVENIRLLDNDGRISVSYAAFDQAGNVSKLQRELEYHNYRSPRFYLNGPLVYDFGSNFDVFNEIGATDDIDGDIKHHVRAMLTEGSSLSTLGTHMVEFHVTNSLGDTTKEIMPVEVYSPEYYNAKLTLKEYLIYLPVGGIFNEKFYPDTFSFNRETYKLGTVLPQNYSLEIQGHVDTHIPGVYPVSYTLTYTEKNQLTGKINSEFVGYSKLIVIVEG